MDGIPLPQLGPLCVPAPNPSFLPPKPLRFLFIVLAKLREKQELFPVK